MTSTSISFIVNSFAVRCSCSHLKSECKSEVEGESDLRSRTRYQVCSRSASVVGFTKRGSCHSEVGSCRGRWCVRLYGFCEQTDPEMLTDVGITSGVDNCKWPRPGPRRRRHRIGISYCNIFGISPGPQARSAIQRRVSEGTGHHWRATLRI